MDDAPGPECPFEIARPVMEHRWDELTFLHWRYPAETVQRLLPPSLTVDTLTAPPGSASCRSS